MYSIDKYNVKIKINLESGIYVFDNESATGKTRLAKMLAEYQAYGEPVISYTYNDYLKGISLNNMIKNKKYEVIMLDRYDLYNGEYSDIIREFSKDTIVLMDCKSEVKNIEDDDWCDITMTADCIEVSQ